MARFAALALALLACLAAAQASQTYKGPASFITSFSSTPAIKLPGAELKLVTGDSVFGLGLAGMAALHIKLSACTILQTHSHPHAEFAYTISGRVTHSTPYNNGTLTSLTQNTKSAGPGGFAVFPANQLHVTQNEGCSPAEVISVFPVPAVDLYFYPYTEAFLPANTIASYFKGKVTASTLMAGAGTAKLAGCKCSGK